MNSIRTATGHSFLLHGTATADRNLDYLRRSFWFETPPKTAGLTFTSDATLGKRPSDRMSRIYHRPIVEATDWIGTRARGSILRFSGDEPPKVSKSGKTRMLRVSQAFKDLRFRRRGLYLSLAIIGFVIGALFLWIRETERE